MSWIKVRTNLRDHPKVVRMASALKADRLRVLGGLVAVWGTFDTHSVDGTLEGYTLASLDEGIGWKGFGAAMVAVRWLEVLDDGLAVPEFDEHNGASAKRRALDAKRKADGRESDHEYGGSWNGGGQMSASNADKTQTREEQDKKKNTPLPPNAGHGGRVGKGSVDPPGFDAFWSAYPRKDAKADALKAFAKVKPDEALLASMLKAITLQRASDQWRKDGGQFVPMPATWLNGRRWEDQSPLAAVGDDIFAGAV